MKFNARPARLWFAIAALVGGVALGTSGCGSSSGTPTGAAGAGAAGTGAAGAGAAGTGAAGAGAAGTGAAGAGAAGAGAAGTGAAGLGAAGTGTAGMGAAGTGASGTNGGAGTTGAAGATTDGGADGAVDKPATEAGTPGDGGAMTLTTTSLKMVDGGLVFPAASSAPMNQSPALMWSGAPAGTLSFAWTIKDLTANNVHFILYDIAPTTTMLPENLPRGAMPAMPAGAIWNSAFGGTPGYQGPGGGGINNYELQLWALKVAKLNIGTMNLNQIYTTLLPMQKLGSATILARGTRMGL